MLRADGWVLSSTFLPIYPKERAPVVYWIGCLVGPRHDMKPPKKNLSLLKEFENDSHVPQLLAYSPYSVTKPRFFTTNGHKRYPLGAYWLRSWMGPRQNMNPLKKSLSLVKEFEKESHVPQTLTYSLYPVINPRFFTTNGHKKHPLIQHHEYTKINSPRIIQLSTSHSKQGYNVISITWFTMKDSALFTYLWREFPRVPAANRK